MDFNEFKSLDFKPLSEASNTKISETELINKIKSAIEEILADKFQNSEKKKVNYEMGGRINFSCPYCGDSEVNYRKKRGNIYKNDFNYKCWNCAQFRFFEDFLSDFGKKELFTPSELKYIRKISESNPVSGFGGNGLNTQLTDLLNIDQYAFPREELMKKAKLIEVDDDPKIFGYLKGRLQINRFGDHKHFAYDKKNDMIFFLNLTRDKSKVIGMQGRFQRKLKSGQRFSSYKYSDIWEKIFEVDGVRDDIKQLMDKFSMVYNILNVNFSKEVYIFEATFDSHHMPNSIAQWGATKKIYLPMGRYFFDNAKLDKEGKRQAVDMLKKGYHIFLWGVFLKDYPIYNDCKDLNDMMRKKPIDIEILKKYFSNNKMDLFRL